jgi:hypothetical protein
VFVALPGTLAEDLLRLLERASRFDRDCPRRVELRRLLDTPLGLDLLESLLRPEDDDDDGEGYPY